MYKLIKYSIPSEEFEVYSENQARDILVNRICGGCLDEVAYSYIDNTGKYVSFQPTLRDLLRTDCGCEWGYEEDDE